MIVTGMELGWIVVKDLQQSIDFYVNTVGLKVKEHVPDFGWAELSGPDGFTLGLAQENENMDTKAGSNAIMTVSVENIEKAIEHFREKGAKLIGDVIEVPEKVKMQTFIDHDGNAFQLVENLD